MADREKLIELLEQVQDEGAIVIPTGQSDRIELVKNQKVADHLIANGVTVRERGRWLSAYEYGIKLGIADKEKLEELKKDKWWKFCDGCEQQVKGFHNFCPNCGADMRGTEDGIRKATIQPQHH